MNFNKFINSDYLKNNPLCGISTYKDTLNLATGACTRHIQKVVLTGEENFVNQTVSGITLVSLTRPVDMPQYTSGIISSHFVKSSPASNVGEFYVGGSYINFNYDGINDVTAFKTYLQQQYTNGTPVVIYYILSTATTETITVPSGLSGTEEGYLNRSGTPTPTNPIYPTANEVKVWHNIPHYIHNTSTDTITTLPADIYANDTTATVGLKGDMEQSSQPSPTTPIQPQECGDLETTGEHTGQYKIPILNNSQTTNVYLGEVQTTRRIKKLVLTGAEDITSGHLDINLFNVPLSDYLKKSDVTTLSTHYIAQANVNGWVEVNDKSVTCYKNTGSPTTLMYIRDSSYATVEAFKTYLQQQYAAGTPVCVWYVLATEETAVVNEPLRKIGDYADEVSGITIPTIAGENTLSIGTTLQPSEVTATYKGWHPVADVHEAENGQWD